MSNDNIQMIAEELAEGIKEQSRAEVVDAAIGEVVTGADRSEVLEAAARILGETPEQVAEEADALLDREGDEDDSEED